MTASPPGRHAVPARIRPQTGRNGHGKRPPSSHFLLFTFGCRTPFWLLVCLALTPAMVTMAAELSSTPVVQIIDLQIGFDGLYKLGCWTPVSLTLRGGQTEETGLVELIVADTDGVPTTVVSAPIRLGTDQRKTISMLVRPGQAQGSLQARWLVAGQVRTQRTYTMARTTRNSQETELGAGADHIPAGLPATNRLLLVLGPAPGIAELVQASQMRDPWAATRIAHTLDTSRMPVLPSGFEGIDTLVLTTSDPTLFDPLLKNPERLRALVLWVEQGGRLLLFCGRSAPDLLGPDGALASLSPGRYQRQIPLRNVLPLETFSGAEKPLARSRLNLRVPKLTDLSGQILAYAGQQPTDLPLIVRAPYRLGEVVFAGIDLDLPPFRDWSGRPSLLRKLLDWPLQENVSKQQRSQIDSTGGDLIAQLRNALDQHLTGISTLSFALVALLIVGYIGLIGPGDFFFVQSLLRRMELTWVTFPLIVVGTSAGAYWLATTSKGSQLRVAQIEIVDVAIASVRETAGPTEAASPAEFTGTDKAKPQPAGLIRGTVWTHFFSPRAARYDLTLRPRLPGQTAPQATSTNTALLSSAANHSESIVSWLGLPGNALGGMQAGGAQTTLLEHGYAFGQSLQSLHGLPVQVWSTKTIQADWTASGTLPIEMELSQTSDHLLVGKITNRLGVELTDCLLIFGRWAYHLARVSDGRTVAINDDLQPRTLKTMLTSATAGDRVASRITDDGTAPFDRFSSDVTRIVKAMMFYEAIGGVNYTGTLNRYQHRIDMSYVLQTDRAILLARAPGTGSQWFDADKPLKSNQDQHWLFYRFVAPVQK